jgi:MFS family permease
MTATEATTASTARGATFRSLRHRNARLYFVGLIVSNAGTWLQSTAMAWLVLELTDDAGALGTVTGAQFLPQLLLGPWAGAIADRTHRQRMVFVTQALATVQAFVLAALTFTGHITVPLVYVLAVALGLVNAFDNPVRRSFITELVEPDEVANAMSLNTAVMTGSRILGPALAGILIALVGTAWCFLGNALSFFAVLAAIAVMDRTQIRRTPSAPRAPRQVREGFDAIWRDPTLRVAFVVLVVVSMLSFNYQVAIPTLVKRAFGGGSGEFGALLSVTSVGSLLGALVVASRRPRLDHLVASCAALGVAMTASAFAPTLWLAFVFAVPTGVAGAALVALTSGMLVDRVAPTLRGRVLALQATVFLGSTPIGSPIVGYAAEHLGSRWGLGIGGVAALAVAPVAWGWRRVAADAAPDAAASAVT